MITQEELKHVIHYNQDSGIFSWILANTNRIKASDIAGSFDKENGYTRITIDGKRYAAHRLAWFYVYGEWPEVIDHINGIGTDNRIVNLRNCNLQQNALNHKKKINKSGLPCGVRALNSKYQARVMFSNKTYYLGVYDTPEEAENVYLAKRQELFGEYHHNDICTKKLTINQSKE